MEAASPAARLSLGTWGYSLSDCLARLGRLPPGPASRQGRHHALLRELA
jgi:hypothetical protein